LFQLTAPTYVGAERGGKGARDQVHGLPDHARGQGSLPGHRQARHNGVGHAPSGHGGHPGAREDGKFPSPDISPAFFNTGEQQLGLSSPMCWSKFTSDVGLEHDTSSFFVYGFWPILIHCI
jgi:hypothetical protein